MTIMKDIRYLLFLIIQLFFFCGASIIIVLFKSYAKACGIPEVTANVLVSILGIGTTVGRWVSHNLLPGSNDEEMRPGFLYRVPQAIFQKSQFSCFYHFRVLYSRRALKCNWVWQLLIITNQAMHEETSNHIKSKNQRPWIWSNYLRLTCIDGLVSYWCPFGEWRIAPDYESRCCCPLFKYE